MNEKSLAHLALSVSFDSRDLLDYVATLDETRDEELIKYCASKIAEVGSYAGDKCSDGVTLIAESYFVEYCKELCQDVGDLPKDIPRYLVIDWEATAKNLKVDYFETSIGGYLFFYR